MKKTYVIAFIAVLTIASAGAAGAVAVGVGPSFSEMKGGVHQLIYSPEAASRAAERRQKGADQTATSTDLSIISRSQKPESSKATSYAEIASTTQSGKIDTYLTVDNTLKNVSFCGKPHRTRQIIVNGVDVAQRIAQLASNDQMGKGASGVSIGKVVCGNMRSTDYTQNILMAEDVITTDSNGQPLFNNEYRVVLGAQIFSIDPKTNEIFIIEGFDGARVGPIGKLK